jgi:hypothetical protein
MRSCLNSLTSGALQPLNPSGYTMESGITFCRMMGIRVFVYPYPLRPCPCRHFGHEQLQKSL